MTSFFYMKLKEDGYSAVQRWTKELTRVNSSIFAKDVIIVPVNYRDSHWCCGIIDMRAKEIR